MMMIHSNESRSASRQFLSTWSFMEPVKVIWALTSQNMQITCFMFPSYLAQGTLMGKMPLFFSFLHFSDFRHFGTGIGAKTRKSHLILYILFWGGAGDGWRTIKRRHVSFIIRRRQFIIRRRHNEQVMEILVSCQTFLQLYLFAFFVAAFFSSSNTKEIPHRVDTWDPGIKRWCMQFWCFLQYLS